MYHQQGCMAARLMIFLSFRVALLLCLRCLLFFGRMGKRLKDVFGSKVAFGLEGGYNLQVGRVHEDIEGRAAFWLNDGDPYYFLFCVRPHVNSP